MIAIKYITKEKRPTKNAFPLDTSKSFHTSALTPREIFAADKPRQKTPPLSLLHMQRHRLFRIYFALQKPSLAFFHRDSSARATQRWTMSERTHCEFVS